MSKLYHFLKGVGSVVDIYPNNATRPLIVPQSSLEDDAQALYQDWIMVGSHLQQAIDHTVCSCPDFQASDMHE